MEASVPRGRITFSLRTMLWLVTAAAAYCGGYVHGNKDLLFRRQELTNCRHALMNLTVYAGNLNTRLVFLEERLEDCEKSSAAKKTP